MKPMKGSGRRVGTVLLMFLALWAVTLPRAMAQEATPTLARMSVQLWPDFDDPSLLVLITGEIAATDSLPQVITLPFPADARLNAVARIDPSGAMFDDLDYDVAAGAITVTSTERAFRIEYYAPYDVDGDRRTVRYEAPTEVGIETFEVRVQQPAAASAMVVEPAGSELLTDSAGLRYHTFAPRALSADEPFVISASYTMESDVLTIDQMPPQTEAQPAAPAPSDAATLPAGDDTNWTLIAIAVVGLSVSAIFLGLGLRDMRRSRTRPEKPRPRRAQPARKPARKPAASPPSGGPAARFCHNCGTQLSAESDRFCRSCGTQLKGR